MINKCEKLYSCSYVASFIELLKLKVDKLNNKEGVDQYLKNLTNIKSNIKEGSKEIKKT